MIGILFLLSRISLLRAQNCPSLLVERDAIGPAMTCGVACKLMELSEADQCRFDVSGCGENVPAGTSCPITCRSPFSGEAALVSCPPGNTVASTPADWVAPDCDLFASDCPRVTELPDSYVEVSGGGFACAEGFAGNAVARCVPDDTCESSLQWFGCQRTAACAPPLNLIGCLLDVTQCSEVKPGGSCPVSCRFPYTGWSSVAVCRPDNVNSEVGLLVVEPECTLTCEDPPNEPEGYVKVSSGNGWACAPGYGGEAKWDCVIDSVCASKKVLSGCSLLARCILPSVENACMYDFTNCIGETASPGESCQVHCKRPYQGNSSNASCPSGNTDPLRELNWEVPNCQIACAEVSDVPVGYLSHPYIRVFGGWQCTDGYAGTPSISCATDANCNPQLRFSGCSALLPCDPPILSPGELCAFQHTCISVRSGDSCEVTCRAPYVGGIAQASCPPNNTQIGRQLIWAVPDCNLQCPMPNPIPSGYQPDGIDNTGLQKWKCAPFWEGTPVVTCFIGDGCVAAYQFSGCVLQTACRVPTDVPCSVDFSDCQNVFAGGTCEVSCGPSFTGNVTEASCPEGNIDPLTPLEWTFPGCVLSCQDPVNPVGYVKTRFMCASNYSGNPASRCAADFNDQCNPTYSFSGCGRVVPCAPPQLQPGSRAARLSSYSAEDQLCMFDFSDCQRVMPGGNCTIRCGSDYEGKSTIAYCPSDNTDPNGQLVYLEPKCSLKPCEMNAPVGYVETPCGWECATGYIGSVSWYCAAIGSQPGRCRSELVISGCTLTVQCAPLMVNDTCRTNASTCTSLQPGQGCNVTCAEPYTGGQGENATWAYCPGSTTIEGQQPMWATAMEEWALDCQIECDLPDPIPSGYLHQGQDLWLCDTANLYSGQALAECVVNDTTCEPSLVLSGCFPTTPCDFPDIDPCQHDVTDCPSDGKMLSGSSCQVKCKAPYFPPLGEAHGSIECRDPNIDPLGAIWTPPSCILGCSEPSSQTGYRNILGEWQCADGYDGAGAIWSECIVDPSSCVAFPRLFGCQPFIQCANPDLTPIQKCMIDLTGGNCLDLQPGEICTVYCQGPNYFGDQLGAGCPATNLDPNKVINWFPPTCFCKEPVPPPAGYLLNPTPNTYRCAPGYYGQANYRCEIDTVTCEPIVTLTGCALLAPCAPPEVDAYDRCKVDFSECDGPFEAGESCNVTCNPGFNVNLSTPECPADNTVLNHKPNLDIYCGEYTCASPDVWAASNPLPQGYDVGTWRCANGFRGSVSTRCVQSDECGGTLQLSGCVPLQACSPPKLHGRDLCRWNFSDCEDVASGGFCDFQCSPPFRGTGRAFCPPDNVDPQTELVFIEPDCALDCPDPDPPPPGYEKLSCGWTCAQGYDGRPQAVCDVNDQCQPQLKLMGCLREEKCVLPVPGSFDACRFDFSECDAETPVGSSCTVKCRSPFSGEDFLAECPSGNTIPQFPLVFDQSNCDLTCPTPNPVPKGYSVNGSEIWSCSEGHVGEAESTCIQQPGCGEPQLTLTGCKENVPCAPPKGQPCQFDTTCGPSLAPGESCEISCKAPFEGNESTMAKCPNPNTIRNGPADWEPPFCSLLCPEMNRMSLPPNYTTVGDTVVCAEGAVGMARVECRINPQCEAFWHFSGCLMLQQCVLPMVDRCRIDVGNCTTVFPGEYCIMSCQADFMGGEVIGRCPDGNTNAGQLIEFDDSLVCTCPPPAAKAGYQLMSTSTASDGGDWMCREGWTGSAIVSCNVNPDTCQMTVMLSGCVALHNCAPPDVAYLSHSDDCQDIPAGEVCEARCAASDCVVGGPLQFTCPAENVDKTQPAVWLSGSCRVRCEVCRTTAFIDTDARPNNIAGTLQFGEAHANGVMPVQGIQGYRVFFANDCGEQVGPSLGYVPRSAQLYSCCAATAYSLSIAAEVPPMATSIRIAINGTLGDLPYGVLVSFTDRAETEVMSTPKPITSSGLRPFGDILLMIVLCWLR